MGRGETEVLMLALESVDAVAILDDAAARRAALVLGVKFTGTLGLLLDAKRAGMIAAVAPLVSRLEELGFHLSARARSLILRKASEDG